MQPQGQPVSTVLLDTLVAEEPSLEARPPVWVAWICFAAALLLLGVAIGVVPDSDTDATSPPWILSIVALVLFVLGCMVLFGHNKRVNDVLAGIVCLGFAAVGAWVSLVAPPEGISGGIPFLSRETNTALGRGVFGLGAIMSLMVAVYAFRRGLRR